MTSETATEAQTVELPSSTPLDGVATYSMADNKLRLYPDHRLDQDVYDRVIAAGFRWAPKQELFVAPSWTPQREDLCAELFGNLEEEDTTPAERAEARAERLEELASNRHRDAAAADATARAIADGIPMGQPILVGHHSEGRARRDQDRIHGAMGRLVENLNKSEYWASKAQATLRHAEHKEKPQVRARRISRLEAEWRKSSREAKRFPGSNAQRWMKHYEGRLAYEREMLGDWTPPAKPPAPKKPPILNYPAETVTCDGSCYANEKGSWHLPQVAMTKAEWARVHRDYRGTMTATGGSHRVRTRFQGGSMVAVFLSDSKTHEAPGPKVDGK